MESHPSYPILKPYIMAYPKSAGAAFQTYNDIVYAQGWKDVKLVELRRCRRVGFTGKRVEDGTVIDTQLHVVPCSLAETLSMSWIQDAFADMSNPDSNPPPSIYLAITDTDSSIVYYKISSGIVKPPV